MCITATRPGPNDDLTGTEYGRALIFLDETPALAKVFRDQPQRLVLGDE